MSFSPVFYFLFLSRRMVATVLSIISQFCTAVMAQRERTFIMIKPDGVHRGLVGEIIKRFETRGYKLVAMKYMQVHKMLHLLMVQKRRYAFWAVHLILICPLTTNEHDLELMRPGNCSQPGYARFDSYYIGAQSFRDKLWKRYVRTIFWSRLPGAFCLVDIVFISI